MTVAGGQERRCAWCKASLAAGGDKWCSKRCRQTAWRFRQGVAQDHSDGQPLRLAYADPPYPGNSRKYYGRQASFAGEVDHAELIATLRGYDGWALSTSRKALGDVLSLCPEGVVVCPWVKTHHQTPSYGPGNIHEYVLVVPGRRRRPGPPDAFVGAVARGGDSSLMGRKPIKFVSWVFALLGADPGDKLDDIFPGSGIVGRCWEEFCRRPTPAPEDGGPGASDTRAQRQRFKFPDFPTRRAKTAA